MYSVAQILRPEFGRSWHEAVAVVQEAASQLVPGVSLPAPDDLLIDSNGILSFGFGSEANENPVVALATLLEQLLEGVEAPPSLVELVNANTGQEPAQQTVEGFVRSLAFFERPNRATDLRAIASRLQGMDPNSLAIQEPANQEFERLRERVSAAPESQPQQPQEQPKRRRRAKLTSRQRGVVAAGIAAGLLIGILAVRFPFRLPSSFGLSGPAEATSSHSPASTAGSTAATTPPASPNGKHANEPLEKPRPPGASPEKPTLRGKNAGTPASGTAGSSAKVDSTAAEGPTRSNGVKTSDVPQPGLASRSLSPTTVRTEPAAVPNVPEAFPSPMPSTNLPAASIAPPPNGVYSPETPGVKPPILVRPQMPQEPKPGDDTGYFDMIVDEKGLVEQVKLISPRRRYHDRMLVAAAKAWQFSPATLDGQPVKYRLLVPIILSGLPY